MIISTAKSGSPMENSNSTNRSSFVPVTRTKQAAEVSAWAGLTKSLLFNVVSVVCALLAASVPCWETVDFQGESAVHAYNWGRAQLRKIANCRALAKFIKVERAHMAVQAAPRGSHDVTPRLRRLKRGLKGMR